MNQAWAQSKSQAGINKELFCPSLIMRQAPPTRCHSTQVRDSSELVLGQRDLTLDTRKNGSLLDGRGLLKTIGIYATEE